MTAEFNCKALRLLPQDLSPSIFAKPVAASLAKAMNDYSDTESWIKLSAVIPERSQLRTRSLSADWFQPG
jgi:hypothetical protein